jgi:hypothetical protein
LGIESGNWYDDGVHHALAVRHGKFEMSHPPTLSEVLQLTFGPAWRQRASQLFRRSRRQIGRWCSGETRIPRRYLVLLQRQLQLPDTLAEIEAWRAEQHRRVDQMADARRTGAFEAQMWVKALLFDRTEWEPVAIVGRPRLQRQTADNRPAMLPFLRERPPAKGQIEKRRGPRSMAAPILAMPDKPGFS